MVDTHVSVRQFWRRLQHQRRQPGFKVCAVAHAAGIGTSIATANRAGSVTLHPGRQAGREHTAPTVLTGGVSRTGIAINALVLALCTGPGTVIGSSRNAKWPPGAACARSFTDAPKG